VASEMGVPTPALAGPALRALVAYAWPGNVRELRNVLERALILGGLHEIALSDLPDEVAAAAAASSAPMDLREATLAFERAHIGRAIECSGGDRREAARLLGIGLSTLYRRFEER